MSWEMVKKEMVQEKGLDEQVADKIGEYCKLCGSTELIDKLLSDPVLTANSDAKVGLEEMKLLFEYLAAYNILDLVQFDLSLARGLDYYTGVIYEAVMEKSKETLGIGSIAAGGRYDNLVGMFSGTQVPCVGVSLGVERIFAILANKKDQPQKSDTKVMVMSPDGNLIERMKISAELYNNNIPTEFLMKEKGKLKSQLSTCEKAGIPVAIIVGKSEIEKNGVVVKFMETKEEMFCLRSEFVNVIKSKLNL